VQNAERDGDVEKRARVDDRVAEPGDGEEPPVQPLDLAVAVPREQRQ
jgi:hypothetical protein